MKQVLFAIVFITAFVINSHSQTYHKFLNNSEWCVSHFNFSLVVYTTYYEVGDTLINQTTWSKIANNQNSEIILLREDTLTRTVYRADYPFNPLYNFSMQIGETNISLGLLDTIIPVQTVAGIRDKYIYDSELSVELLEFIEGVGSTSHPFGHLYGGTEPIYSLKGVTQNNQLIYVSNWNSLSNCDLHYLATSQGDAEDNAKTIEIHPNPFSDELNLSFTLPANEKLSVSLIDANGRKILISGEYAYKKGTNRITVRNLPELSAGLYLLVMEGKNTYFSGKVVRR